MKEGPWGDKLHISSPHGVPALLFEMVQETQHEGRVQVAQCQRRRGLSGLFCLDAAGEHLAVVADGILVKGADNLTSLRF